MQRNGRVNSGDVSIFYRAFGARGATPILLMHGANYFDSYDWIGVGEALATNRETASFDKRGFGETGWSPSKDYSVDANMGDILAVIRELGWEKPIVVGHSASGRLSIAFAAAFPDKLSRLIVVDSGMARDEGGGGNRPPTGNPPLVFESVDAAMAHFAKLRTRRASRTTACARRPHWSRSRRASCSSAIPISRTPGRRAKVRSCRSARRATSGRIWPRSNARP